MIKAYMIYMGDDLFEMQRPGSEGMQNVWTIRVHGKIFNADDGDTSVLIMTNSAQWFTVLASALTTEMAERLADIGTADKAHMVRKP